MCHPEQAKRVEPQAKRRGGCRVSGRRDLSWNYGCFCLDPTSRYPHRCCYAVRLRAYRPPLRMTHGRCIFVIQPRRHQGTALRLDGIKGTDGASSSPLPRAIRESRSASLCATRLTKNRPVGCFSKPHMPYDAFAHGRCGGRSNKNIRSATHSHRKCIYMLGILYKTVRFSGGRVRCLKKYLRLRANSVIMIIPYSEGVQLWKTMSRKRSKRALRKSG